MFISASTTPTPPQHIQARTVQPLIQGTAIGRLTPDDRGMAPPSFGTQREGDTIHLLRLA